jgi:hypothetical protein
MIEMFMPCQRGLVAVIVDLIGLGILIVNLVHTVAVDHELVGTDLLVTVLLVLPVLIFAMPLMLLPLTHRLVICN